MLMRKISRNGNLIEMLLDTNAISAIGDKNPEIMKVLDEAESIEIPFIAIAEFRYGLLGSKRPEAGLSLLERLSESAPVLFPDHETIAQYAWISDHLKRKGRPIPHNDIWLAALARQHSLEVLSMDSHFDHVEQLQRIGW